MINFFPKDFMLWKRLYGLGTKKNVSNFATARLSYYKR